MTLLDASPAGRARPAGRSAPASPGQAVRLANELGELSRLGAEVVLASVDPPAAQLAMNAAWRQRRAGRGRGRLMATMADSFLEAWTARRAQSG